MATLSFAVSQPAETEASSFYTAAFARMRFPKLAFENSIPTKILQDYHPPQQGSGNEKLRNQNRRHRLPW